MVGLIGFYSIALATSMSLMEIASTLLVLFCLYLIATKKIAVPKLRDVPFAKPILLMALIASLGILLSGTTVKEKIYDLGRMRFFILYFFVYLSLTSLEGNRPWIRVLLWTTALVSVYGFVQHFISIDLIRPEGKKVLMYALQEEKIGPLVVGTFNHHLTFSNIYLFFGCLFFSLGLGKTNFRLTLFGLFLFLLVAWTHSRMAWVAIPVCLVVSVYYLRGRKAAFTALVLGVLALSAVYFSSHSLRERFERSFVTSQEVSYAPRLRLWHAQWEMFKEHPLLGMGWNTNERRAKDYVDRLYPNVEKNFYGHAHSMLLQILATTGVIGFAAFLWIWFEVFQSLLLSVKRLKGEDLALAVGLLSAFVGFWIQGLTQWNFGDAEVTHSVVFFWAVAATLYSQAQNSPHTVH